MAIAGILGSILFPAITGQSSSPKSGLSAFQRLEKDLQSGNLAGAQSDFAALTQNASGTQLGGVNSISQAFNTLGQALKAGNLSAAQKDFSTLQQDLEQAYGASRTHHHHHHYESGVSGQQTEPISEAFGSLSQALQSGNLAAAQRAYSTIQADMAQLASSAGTGGGSTSSTPTQSASSRFSVSA